MKATDRMKAVVDKYTPTTPLDVIDHINHETNFAHGIVAAIRGLECLNDKQREGVLMFAEAHVEQLVEIRSRLQRVMQTTPELQRVMQTTPEPEVSTAEKW